MPAGRKGATSTSSLTADDGHGSLNTSTADPLSGVMDNSSLDKLDVILTRVTNTLIASFNTSLQQLVTVFTQNVQLKLDFQSNEIFNLNTRLDNLEKQNDSLKKDNDALVATIKSLETKHELLVRQVDDNDQHARLDNLILHGVPVTGPTEDLFESLPQLLNGFFPDLQLDKTEISVVHRLQATQNPSSSANQRPRPPAVIVRFTRKSTRNFLLQNRKQLKGKTLAVSEHLTTRRAALLKRASTLVTQGRLSAAWTKDGKLLVKSLSNQISSVFTDLDLARFE
jgi:hypothetical protein